MAAGCAQLKAKRQIKERRRERSFMASIEHVNREKNDERSPRNPAFLMTNVFICYPSRCTT
jgi:hypothetical protein